MMKSCFWNHKGKKGRKGEKEKRRKGEKGKITPNSLCDFIFPITIGNSKEQEGRKQYIAFTGWLYLPIISFIFYRSFNSFDKRLYLFDK
jgi:hypothetical protein